MKNHAAFVTAQGADGAGIQCHAMRLEDRKRLTAGIDDLPDGTLQRLRGVRSIRKRLAELL